MAAKMSASPSPAARGSFLQVRVTGLKKGVAHLLVAEPPVGPADERFPIPDADGTAAESFYLFAPGTWSFHVRPQRDDDTAADLSMEVAG